MRQRTIRNEGLSRRRLLCRDSPSFSISLDPLPQIPYPVLVLAPGTVLRDLCRAFQASDRAFFSVQPWLLLKKVTDRTSFRAEEACFRPEFLPVNPSLAAQRVSSCHRGTPVLTFLSVERWP